MPYYTVNTWDITDQQAFASSTREPAPSRVEAHGGKLLALGEWDVIGGEWASKRGNIVEWPDRAAYDAFSASPSGTRLGVTGRGTVGLEGSYKPANQ